MYIIQSANTDILSKLERLFWDFNENLNYKLASYVIKTQAEDGTVLLFNDVTKEIVALEPEENIFTQFFLMRLFIVPEDFDDTMLPLLIRGVTESQRELTISPVGYTILTTTTCNARCFYCYEKGATQRVMSEKTAKDTADFIIRNYEKDRDGDTSAKPISISWFGGEPLFRKKCIDIIVKRLKEAGVPFLSSMISNGFLFNEQTINDAVDVWNLKNVQITVDGTRDVYNKTKSYIYKNVDAYEVVLNNIKNISEKGVKVSIRINVGRFNTDDVINLVKELGERFGGNESITVYASGLYYDENNCDENERDAEGFYSIMEDIDAKISEVGLSPYEPLLNDSYPNFHCMTDSGKSLCILPDGGLTLCEHFVDSHKISTIYDFPDKIDYDMVKACKKVREPYERCYGCPLLMDCTYLDVCSSTNPSCSEDRKKYLLKKRAERVVKRYDEAVRQRKQAAERKLGTD